MKKFNLITKKILLLVMFLFVLHDFAVVQVNTLVLTENVGQSADAKEMVVMASAEHNVFHHLLHIDTPYIYTEPITNEKINTKNTFLQEDIRNKIYTPPRTS